MAEGETLTFRREISGAGASTYWLDEREVPWETYDEQLRELGLLVKAKNFLVFQARGGGARGLAGRARADKPSDNARGAALTLTRARAPHVRR